MKLSDIKGERTLEVIADIIDPVANIAADSEASEMFRRVKLPEGEDPVEYTVKRMKRCMPKLLKGHKTDVISILAVIEGVEYEEYAESLSLTKLLSDFSELLADPEFLSLFFSAQTKKTET